MPAISITNLNLQYKHHWLFHDFNLTFPDGKWSALLGSSGVGKTTILRFIANLLNNQDTKISGTLTAADQQALTTKISYMAQQDLLLPWLSVLDNVLIGYRLRGTKNLKPYKQQAIELLKKIGLGAVIKFLPEKLSGGMRQRVALVRTLLENRPIVLMDEPFSALDSITRLQIQDLAAELLVGRTVVLVTHDPLEALRLCDCIYVIKGAPAQLSTLPAPVGQAPRDATNPELLQHYAQLLKLLGGAVI